MWVLFEAGVIASSIIFKDRLEADAADSEGDDSDESENSELSEEEMDSELDRIDEMEGEDSKTP